MLRLWKMDQTCGKMEDAQYKLQWSASNEVFNAPSCLHTWTLGSSSSVNRLTNWEVGTQSVKAWSFLLLALSLACALHFQYSCYDRLVRIFILRKFWHAVSLKSFLYVTVQSPFSREVGCIFLCWYEKEWHGFCRSSVGGPALCLATYFIYTAAIFFYVAATYTDFNVHLICFLFLPDLMYLVILMQLLSWIPSHKQSSTLTLCREWQHRSGEIPKKYRGLPNFLQGF